MPGLYFKKDPELVCVVHGDDFATVGDDQALDYLDEVLQGSILIKRLGRVGPGGSRAGLYLKRRIEWRDDRFVYYANPKHVQDIVVMLGLESAKGQDTPGSKATGASVAEENKPLSDAEADK